MKSIEIYNMEEDYPAAEGMIEAFLQRNRINKVTRTETMMVFEALYHNLQEQLEGSDTPVTISARHRLGDLRLTIGFEGGMMDPTTSDDELSPEARILEAYYDKIDYNYGFGYNTIDITVRNSSQRTQIIYLLVVLLAVIVYIPIRTNTDMAARQGLLDDYIYPLEQLFANAMLMIAAPVTFISLLKNRTNAYIVSQWNPNVKRLHRASLHSSIVAVILAVVAGLVADDLFRGGSKMLMKYKHMRIEISFADSISDLLPSNIFDPFITISPFPLLILTFMVIYALFSAGKHFSLIYEMIDAFYDVLSRMLSIIMTTMPFFLLVAMLDLLLQRGFPVLLYILQLFIVVMVSLVLLWLFYAFQLKRAGIPPFRFMKTINGLLQENYMINSVIDAVPYNIRWCVQHLRLDRKKLQESMPFMAQIELDGNCFLITLTTLIFVLFSGTETTMSSVFSIAVLVLFLSMGAPNQPGSCLIGILIILYHVNAFTLIALAILTEALFGGMQNLVNVLGGIVIIAVDDARHGSDSGKAGSAVTRKRS